MYRTNVTGLLIEAYPEDPVEWIRNSEPTDHVFIDVFENDEGFQVTSLQAVQLNQGLTYLTVL